MKLKLVVIFGILVILTSCDPIRRHNFILLIDNSRTISEITLNKYLQVIRKDILPNLGRYDCLTIQLVDECSLRESERVFTLNLAEINFSSKADGLNNERDSSFARMKRLLRDSIQTAIQTTILSKRKERNTCGDYTDLINGLIEAKSLITYEKNFNSTFDEIKNEAFGKENYTYENIIIIFSDMVNESVEIENGKANTAFDFTKFGKLSKSETLNQIQKLNEIDKIPNLKGCEVFIYGATSTANAGIYANKQIENCKLFWQAFFTDCGANLRAYSFDSRKEIIEYLNSLE